MWYLSWPELSVLKGDKGGLVKKKGTSEKRAELAGRPSLGEGPAGQRDSWSGGWRLGLEVESGRTEIMEATGGGGHWLPPTSCS